MTIVKMIFGSHLYGTDGPASDRDYKGVLLPTKREVYLGRIPKSINTSTKKGHGHGERNSPEDIDTEIFSLHYFIQLACEGQTVALDMLHAPDNMLLETSDVWADIIANRHRFYTKNLRTFIGYARRQAAKYGIRGSRLNAANEFLAFLRTLDPEARLVAAWDRLPLGEHIVIREDNDTIRQVQVCGKIFQETTKAGYVIPILEQFADAYGERAKQAANNEGIDWKAVSHAIRAAIQVKELLTTNTITFPLKDAPMLKLVKSGSLDYNTEAAPILDALMSEVEILANQSTLPEKADHKYWEQFIIDTMEKYL